jgi:hypothetical protein
MVVRLVSADEPCPRCLAPLRLVPALRERQIRCRGCKSLLAVSVRPWRLSLVNEENSSDNVDDAVGADLGRIANPSSNEDDLSDGLPIRPTGKPTASLSPIPTAPHALPDKPAVVAEPTPESETVPEPEAAPAPNAIAEPKAVLAPEAAPDPPRKPSIGVPAAAATLFNPHAIDEPRRNPRAAGIGLGAAALVALAAGAWWLFSGPRIHPEARYLPAACQRFVSIRWSLLAGTGIDPSASEAPGLIPIQRCRIFLKNAAIEPAEVERINVGVAADGEGTLLVYRLTRPVRAEAILESPPFRDPQKRSPPPKTVGGVVLYPLGRTALAFPDSRTIVNGETDLLKETLARRGTFADPLNRLLGTLDFSAPVVIASVGAGEPMQSLLQRSGVKSEAISGTTDCFQPGPTVPLLCVLHLRDRRSADSVAAALQRAMLETAEDPKTAQAVRRLLAGSRVWAADGKVQVQWTVQGDATGVQSLALLKPLFY